MSYLLILQGVYYFITGLWPLIHLSSFLFVTGPKTDIWLIKALSLLVVCIGIVLMKASTVRFPSTAINLLAILSALAFTLIDFYYPFTNIISKVYIVDGLIQFSFIITWAVLLIRRPVIQQRF